MLVESCVKVKLILYATHFAVVDAFCCAALVMQGVESVWDGQVVREIDLSSSRDGCMHNNAYRDVAYRRCQGSLHEYQ
jgi:hypothetical protein